MKIEVIVKKNKFNIALALAALLSLQTSNIMTVTTWDIIQIALNTVKYVGDSTQSMTKMGKPIFGNNVVMVFTGVHTITGNSLGMSYLINFGTNNLIKLIKNISKNLTGNVNFDINHIAELVDGGEENLVEIFNIKKKHTHLTDANYYSTNPNYLRVVSALIFTGCILYKAGLLDLVLEKIEQLQKDMNEFRNENNQLHQQTHDKINGVGSDVLNIKTNLVEVGKKQNEHSKQLKNIIINTESIKKEADQCFKFLTQKITNDTNQIIENIELKHDELNEMLDELFSDFKKEIKQDIFEIKDDLSEIKNNNTEIQNNLNNISNDLDTIKNENENILYNITNLKKNIITKDDLNESMQQFSNNFLNNIKIYFENNTTKNQSNNDKIIIEKIDDVNNNINNKFSLIFKIADTLDEKNKNDKEKNKLMKEFLEQQKKKEDKKKN